MPTITSANVANAIVKLVAADALPALVGNLVMGNLVNRDYEPTLAQAGDTVNIPIPPTLVANNIAEGGMVQAQNPSLGNAQIVLNTHAEATFQIPDITKVLAVPDLLRVYMEPAVVAIAERIESDLLGQPSRWRLQAVPVVTTMIGSGITLLPFIATAPVLPPLGLLIALGWRLLRPELWAAWVALPLGLADDLITGTTPGTAMTLWTISFLALDMMDNRMVWRDYWLDWLVAAALIVFCILGGWLVAGLTGLAMVIILRVLWGKPGRVQISPQP